MKWQALKEMNKKGIYSPEQINDTVDKNWDSVNPDGDTIVNKEKCKEMVENAVNHLGSLGDGGQFDEDAFNKAYKKADPWGTQKILKPVVLAMVTSLVTKPQ